MKRQAAPAVQDAMPPEAALAVQDAMPPEAAAEAWGSRSVLAVLVGCWAVPMAAMGVIAFGLHAPPWSPAAADHLPAGRWVLFLAVVIIWPVALFLPLVLLPGGRAHIGRLAAPGSPRRALWTVTASAGLVLELLSLVAVGLHAGSKHSDRPAAWLAISVTGAFLLAGAALLAILLGAAGPARPPRDRVPRLRLPSRR